MVNLFDKVAAFCKVAQVSALEITPLTREAICRIDNYKKYKMIKGEEDWNVRMDKGIYDFPEYKEYRDLRKKHIVFTPKFPGPIPLTIKFSAKVDANEKIAYQDGLYKYREYPSANEFKFDVAFLHRTGPLFLVLKY